MPRIKAGHQEKPTITSKEFIVATLSGLILVSGYFYWQFPEVFQNMFVGIPAGLHRGSPAGLMTHFLGGDHIQVMYLGWKLKQALAGAGFSVLTDYYNFYDIAKPFYDFHIGVQFQLIALMSGLIGSATAGYVLTMLPLTGFLTFISGYVLAAQVSPSPVIRFLSGVYFVVIPYRMIQTMGGHSGGAVLFLHCLYWAAVLRAKTIDGAKFAPYLAGLALLLLTTSDEHQGYYAILFSGIVLPIWFIQKMLSPNSDWKTELKSYLLRWAPLVAGLVLTIGYGLIVDAVALNPGDGISSERELSDVAIYSVLHQRFFSELDAHNIGSILGPMVLVGILAVLLSRKLSPKDIMRSVMFPFLICAALAVMLTGGVHSMKHPGIYGFFFDYVPYFSYQRVPTKMFSSTAIFLVILIAALHTWSFRELSQHQLKKYALAVTVLISAAISIQIFQMHVTLTKSGRPLIDPVYTAVPAGDVNLIKREISESEPILFLPAHKVMDRYATKQQLMAVLTERRYSGGYNGNAPMSYLTTVETVRPANHAGVQEDLLDPIVKRNFKAIVFDLNGPTDMYDRDSVKSGRFDKFFSKPICGQTLCVLRLLQANGTNSLN